jgi:thymidylate synthase (FAD)
MRPNSPFLDALIESGHKFPVLNDGFIRVVDYMGNDSSIVQAARVSYGAGTKKVSEDRALIRYLLRHWHTTPFEMATLKLHVRVPMDAWRQWIRHRTFSVNEYSTRYSEAIDSRQTTAPDQWRSQAKNNKQGSGNYLDPLVGKELTEAEKSSHSFSDTIYQERLAKGVAREQARKDLPLSTYTEAYWSGNLHNLLHFLRLRMDSHAQKEIRDYACVIGEEIVKGWVPSVWSAFEDYRMNTVQFTALDIRVYSSEDPVGEAIELGWLDENGKPKRSRERLEFEAKMEALGNPINWLEDA